MKTLFQSSLLLTVLLTTQSAFGMGQAATVFDKGSPAGIWDHGNEFYMRMDLESLADLKNPTFVWAGFHFDGSSGFKGEVVANQYEANEQRFQAEAKLLHSNKSGRYYLVEVFGTDGSVIKEFFIKGPVSALPDR